MRLFLGIICILVICILNIASVHKNLHDLICSDSYSTDGDANSQYNFEPYFNENKQQIYPFERQ